MTVKCQNFVPLKFIAMKNIITLLSLALFFGACQSDEETEVKPNSTGTATGVGKPVGVPIQKVIGPAGGSISTPGNEVTVSIPAGALIVETPVSIQPVENQAFGGTGLGYELGPANITLNKPATVSWNFKDEDVSGSAPEALGMAQQTAERKWKIQSVTLEKEKRKISASINQPLTFAFFERFKMRIGKNIIAPGENTFCDVAYQEGSSNTGSDDDLLEPLVSYKEVKDWRLNGLDIKDASHPELGLLSYNAETGQAQYLAPLKMPKKNEIAISVEVILKNNKAKLLLIQGITIQTPNAFEINGYRADTAYLGAISLVDGQICMAALSESHLDDQVQASVGFSIAYPFPGVGEYQVSDSKTGPQVLVTAQDHQGKLWSDKFANPGGKTVYGPVTVKISYYDASLRLFEGSISGTLHYYNPQTKEHKTAKVAARFRAADPH
jgi:hypothetical protein